MFYSDEFVENLKDDPVGGVVEICKQATAFADQWQEWTEDGHRVLQEALALILEIQDSELLQINVTFPQMDGNFRVESGNIFQFLKETETEFTAEASKLRLQSLRSHFRTGLGNNFAYEFSQGDLDRVQELINSLRDLIAKNDKFELEHQQRLLRRLEKLQAELHKKVSDLDRFWGLIGDAGVVVGKFGNDAKPIFDRIIEIANIVWRTQSRAEELPSGSSMPFLEQKPNTDGESE